MGADQGSQAKLAFGDTTGGLTEPLQFIKESIGLHNEIYIPDGIVGTREILAERSRENIRHVAGTVDLEPNPAELAYILKRILGGTPSGTSYPLADTVPSFAAIVDRITKVWTYSTLYVNKGVFRAQQGGPLAVSLDILGTDESVGNAGTFPSLTINTAGGGPFMMSDLAITVAGTAYKFFDFTLTVDNMLEMRHLNSLTPTSITPRFRRITLDLDAPSGDAIALYGTQIPGSAVVATFTNGAQSLAFSLPSVQYPKRTPTVPGKTEIHLPIQGIATKPSGSGASLAVTLDSTP